MNTQTVELDLSKRGGDQCVAIGQGDAGGTTIEACIYDNGSEAALDGGSAAFVARLPDRAHYVRDEDCEVSGNVVTYVVNEEAVAAVAGYTDEAYFEIVLDGATYSTERFALDVKRSALDGQAGASWDNRVEAAIGEAEAAAEAANAAAASAVETAEAAAASAVETASEAASAAAATAAEAADAANAAAEAATEAASAANAAAEGVDASTEAANAAADAANSAASAAAEAADAANSAAETAGASATNADASAEAASLAAAEALEAAEEARGAVSDDMSLYLAYDEADDGIEYLTLVDTKEED